MPESNQKRKENSSTPAPTWAFFNMYIITVLKLLDSQAQPGISGIESGSNVKKVCHQAKDDRSRDRVIKDTNTESKLMKREFSK